VIKGDYSFCESGILCVNSINDEVPPFLSGFYPKALLVEFLYISEISEIVSDIDDINFFIINTHVVSAFVLLFVSYERYEIYICGNVK